MKPAFAVTARRIFDGNRMHADSALVVEGDKILSIVSQAELPAGMPRSGTPVSLITPGFIDLQVNGGGGTLFNNDPTETGIRTICQAHARFGTTALMVTFITDRPELKRMAITAGAEAEAHSLPGYLGLHLEGPHLSVARKGTHDPALIRPMTEDDLAYLEGVACSFGLSMITVAPESVTPEQVKRLKAAGYRVSLGHTDTQSANVTTYVEAGASMVTHLFNAMSQLGNREPGLVGAALTSPALHCGLIADGFHVDPVSMRVALAAKQGPAHIFLVTDAMSTIGSDETSFDLNGRTVYRRDGRLTLADGTLAGADIDMLSCIRFVHQRLGSPLDEALRMATVYPAEAVGAADRGTLERGKRADFVLLDEALDLRSTWIGGSCVYETASLQDRATA
ncbi:N-acetylglucosamine-6-phosphate deacetylase [Rhizobium glycinendophyticum]|uniref:N-acetylglucosamine-6-phosphate deacetylase n=1 Tax=Rhizobium glycinendophyticum TaxID=2589807 RepID=A0A504TZR2_9HYPH|nr:N-acetylglucosamine-6-phosphate deacetylase [Rhizobium glycinendophyticum]TPP06727.1 N-acetylglucosamine-6-phosphate deacetylase [Rhizobium glycinendophyticum]